MSGEEWTPEDVHRLHKLQVEGRTYSEIARALGRTREAVAGKIARIKGRGAGGFQPRKFNGSPRDTHDDAKYIQPWKDRKK